MLRASFGSIAEFLRERVGSSNDGILAVRGVHKRDFLFLYFRLLAGQIDFDARFMRSRSPM
jgi:hypothetical protein